MKLSVKLHPNSSQEKIEKISENEYEVWIKEKPVDNKANIKLVKFLKKELGREVVIKSGFTSRKKVVEVVGWNGQILNSHPICWINLRLPMQYYKKRQA